MPNETVPAAAAGLPTFTRRAALSAAAALPLAVLPVTAADPVESLVATAWSAIRGQNEAQSDEEAEYWWDIWSAACSQLGHTLPTTERGTAALLGFALQELHDYGAQDSSLAIVRNALTSALNVIRSAA